MYLAIIRGYAPLASFRIPEAHTFQQTLPLPPYTTLIGMLGAALGLELPDAFAWFKKHELKVGVRGSHLGQCKDFWKIQKIKDKEVISAVLPREYLVDLSLTLVFGAPIEETAKTILQAFLAPAYALTAGNSDSLMLVHRKRSTLLNLQPTPATNLDHLLFPGEISSQYSPSQDILSLPIMESIQAPVSYRLPVDFSFDADQTRHIEKREVFTFIGHNITLTQPVNAYLLEEGSVILR